METLLKNIERLNNPHHVLDLAKLAFTKIAKLTEDALKPNADVIERLDDISNDLCSVLDPMECAKLTSKDPYLKDAANEAIDMLTPLLNSLNRDSQLYNALVAFKKDNILEGEKKAVAEYMIQDYSFYGFHRSNLNEITQLHDRHDRLMKSVSIYFRRGRVPETLYADLFDVRGKLAKSLGYENFSEMVLRKNMIKPTDQVKLFLKHCRGLPLWHAACFKKLIPNLDLSIESNWNSIESITAKMLRLCGTLFGLEFQIVPNGNGLQRVQVWDKQSKEEMGIIYLDLLASRTKQIGPSHFTLFGSKWLPLENRRQPSAMYVSCNFTNPKQLSFENISSLFHEFGHALHGIMSTTHYQTLSGTRCPLDFAEYPSMLLERFASSWDVMVYLGATPLSRRAFEEFQNERFSKDKLQAQLHIASTDLFLHSSEPGQIKNRLEKDKWICEIEHFNNYGSSYYSYVLADYLVSRTLDVFVTRSDFTKSLRSSLLSKGGAADHLEILKDLGVDIEILVK